MLPNTLNPAFVFIGAFFAVAVAKGSYGGLGSNWLNPALAGWLFIRFSWPDFFMLSIKDSRLSASGTIGVLSAPDDFLGRALFNGIESLNQTIFQTFSCEIPSGFASFCVNTGTGIIADRGVLALIAASLVICASMQKFILPAVYLAVYLTLARLAGFVPGSHGEMGDVFYCLFSGGTILTAFVLAADPATSPKSPVGKMGMAVFAALLSFVFRYICAELYGAFFTVAALNVLCAALRAEESKRIYNRVKGGAGEAYIWN
jgi:electron transport complex protein RnfD